MKSLLDLKFKMNLVKRKTGYVWIIFMLLFPNIVYALEGLSFSTFLNKQDSISNPALYGVGDNLVWNYQLSNLVSGFNANVCFFLKDMSNNAVYDITNEPILRRANEQYCTSPNLGCPITLINRPVGTTSELSDRKLKGDIIRYTFVSGDLPLERDYQLIAQLRNPNDKCSNPDGSIINAVPIVESINYFKYGESINRETQLTQRPKIKIFLLTDVNTCIVGNQCTTNDCVSIKDLRTDQIVRQFNKEGLLALPPIRLTPEQRSSAYCMNLKFNPSEIDAVRNEVFSFRDKVVEYSDNKINPDIQIININNGAGIEMAQYGVSFWVPPNGIHKAVSSFYSRDTDFTFVVTDIKDHDKGVYFDSSLCDGSVGSQYNYGIGYTWIPKGKDGPGCANDLTLVHGFLHQLANAINKINPPPSPFASYGENNYLYNGQRLSCSMRFNNPYSYFPDADVAFLDPDFDSCRGNFGDDWTAGYCTSLVARGFDGEECNRRWDKHLLGDHFPSNYNIIGNACRNGRQDDGESEVDSGGLCSIYSIQVPTIPVGPPCPGYGSENPTFLGCRVDGTHTENARINTTYSCSSPFNCYECMGGYTRDPSRDRCVSAGTESIPERLPEDCIPLQDNHPRETKLKIAIVGSSYGAVNNELFIRDANRIKDQILSFEPFRSNSNKINFYALNSENDFGCHFNCQNIERLLCCTNWQVTDFVSTKCPYNKIILVFNSPLYGGAGQSIAITSNGGRAIDLNVPTHEFGHVFGGLADEYNYNTGHIPYSQSDVNCDNNPQCPKWSNLIGRYENDVTKSVVTVGCFEGCKYQQRGLYRPIAVESIMLDLRGDFGPVNERHLTRLLESYR